MTADVTMPISDRCYHIEVSPGQMCTCLDTLMWTRLAYELACRRIVELEDAGQHHTPTIVTLPSPNVSYPITDMTCTC
jgi:hypothetical protein